jgi:hypothetical protein
MFHSCAVPSRGRNGSKRPSRLFVKEVLRAQTTVQHVIKLLEGLCCIGNNTSTHLSSHETIEVSVQSCIGFTWDADTNACLARAPTCCSLGNISACCTQPAWQWARRNAAQSPVLTARCALSVKATSGHLCRLCGSRLRTADTSMLCHACTISTSRFPRDTKFTVPRFVAAHLCAVRRVVELAAGDVITCSLCVQG